MGMKNILLVWIAFCSFLPMFGQQGLFDEGNELYRKNEFSAAAEKYQEVLNTGWESAELYFNLGNACFKKGSLGEAVWAYEKALELNPNYEDAQVNLGHVQGLLIDEIIAVPTPLVERYFRVWADSLGTTGFQVLAVVWLWIITLCWILWKWRKTRGAVLGMGLGSFLFLTTGISWYVHGQLVKDENRGVILVENVYVKTAPSEQAPDAFVLHEGTVVFLKSQVDAWQEIRLADGQVGWMDPSVLKEI